VTPLAELNPVVDGYLVGWFKSRRRLAEFESEPSRNPVYRLCLADAIGNDGTALGEVAIVHTSETVAAARLVAGEPVGIVFDEGWLAKVVRLDPPDAAGPETILDESLTGVEVPPDSPLASVGILPRSYSPARPWLERFLPHLEHLPDDIDGFLFLSELENGLLLELIPKEVTAA
jgi:hypothetical protein